VNALELLTQSSHSIEKVLLQVKVLSALYALSLQGSDPFDMLQLHITILEYLSTAASHSTNCFSVIQLWMYFGVLAAGRPGYMVVRPCSDTMG
jgi:hypothetical protein